MFINIDNETKKSVSIFFMIFGIFVIGTFIYSEFNRNSELKEKLLRIEKKTIVTDVYVDRHEHNSNMVKFADGKTELRDYPYKIGDSISKAKNDSIVYIFRNSKVIKYNILEYYRRNTNMKL